MEMTTIRLETREYLREEIAEIMSISPKDHNFARKVKSRLDNWGYEYKYSAPKVVITKAPLTSEERLKELLIRKLHLDIQTNLKGFALVFYLLATDYGFATSPWLTKENTIVKEYGYDIDDGTMRHWASKLIRANIIAKDISAPEPWRTVIVNGSKKQERLDMSDEKTVKEKEEYYKLRSEYLREADMEYQKVTQTEEKNPNRWKIAIKRLWKEKHCCYYTVKPFVYNAFFDDDEYREIFDLIQLIGLGVPPIEELAPELFTVKPSESDTEFVF